MLGLLPLLLLVNFCFALDAVAKPSDYDSSSAHRSKTYKDVDDHSNHYDQDKYCDCGHGTKHYKHQCKHKHNKHKYPAYCDCNEHTSPTCELYPIAVSLESLQGIQEGDSITLSSGSEAGQFGWLSWKGYKKDEKELAKSLEQPGDSHPYCNPDDPEDSVVSVGDWVASAYKIKKDKYLNEPLDRLIGESIVLPVWDETRGDKSKRAYRVSGFATVSITDYTFSKDSKGKSKSSKYAEASGKSKGSHPYQQSLSLTFLSYTQCDAGNQAPVVVIDSPTDRTSLPLASTIPILSSATDEDGEVIQVDYTISANGVSQTYLASGDNPYAYEWTPAAPGAYTIQASATDNDGRTGVSSVIEVFVESCELYPIAISSESLEGVEIGEHITVHSGSEPGQFGWLSWDGDKKKEKALAESFEQPGDSDTYCNPDDDQDAVVSVGDWVASAYKIKQDKYLNEPLDQLIGEPIILPVWDQTRGDKSKRAYRVSGFATVSIIDFTFSKDSKGKSKSSKYAEASDRSKGSYPYRQSLTLSLRSYTSCDGSGGGNQAPVADDQSLNLDEDSLLELVLTGSDPDGDPLTYSLTSAPQNGTLTGTAPELSYTPNLNYHGSDSFTFSVSDGTLESPIATVDLQIAPVNDGDSLPDDWEQVIVDADPNDALLTTFDVLGVDPGDGTDSLYWDYDGDGIDNATEYAQGRLATVADADVDYYVDAAQGSDHYTGHSATPGYPTALDGPMATLDAAVQATVSASQIFIFSGSYDLSTLDLSGKQISTRTNGNVIFQ